MSVDTDTGEVIEETTAIGKLASDVEDLLAEHLPLVQAALANTHCQEPASITIKIAWVPGKEGTETKAGEPFHVEVSAKAALPSSRISREVDVTSVGSKKQMVLFGAN